MNGEPLRNRVSTLLAVVALSAAPASAQLLQQTLPSQPSQMSQSPQYSIPLRPSTVELILQSHDKVIDMLSSMKPLGDLVKDTQMFTSSFRNRSATRGAGWELLTAAGKPWPPGVFDGVCTANSTDIMLRQIALSSPSRLKKPVNPNCSFSVQCEAHVMRVGGCYKVEVDLCVDMQDKTKIDKVRSANLYPEFDPENPNGRNPCQQEAERQKDLAKEATAGGPRVISSSAGRR
jgi:hypothetical protein